MLNGVSHDLRTILTRFRLSLALMKSTREIDDLTRDVDEMSRMLEGYLAFARGDSAEAAMPTDMRALLDDLRTDVERLGFYVDEVALTGAPIVTVRRRTRSGAACSTRLERGALRGDGGHLRQAGDPELFVSIDDDGHPGIPAESRGRRSSSRSCASTTPAGCGRLGPRPCHRTDRARAHGGDITLHDGHPLGGCGQRYGARRL